MFRLILGYLLMLLSLLLLTVGAATLVSMFYALTLSVTVAAISSAFGRLVIGVVFLTLAKASWDAGRRRIKQDGEGQGAGAQNRGGEQGGKSNF